MNQCLGKSSILRISCEKIIKNNKEECCLIRVTCTRPKELPVGSLVSNSTGDCRCIENLIKEIEDFIKESASVIFKKHMSNGSI